MNTYLKTGAVAILVFALGGLILTVVLSFNAIGYSWNHFDSGVDVMRIR